MCVNEDKILRMKDLIKALTEADIAYYRDDDPVMSDREYDQLTDELLKLEAETGLVISGSPTQKVSGEVLEELTSVRHTKPMLSAKKTKSIEEMVRFAGGRSVLVSWKLDGLTIVLRYENGELKQSITRGREGTVGEDVTHTVRTYLNVPLTIPIRDSIEVRGEGVISWRHFNLINSDLEDTYSHPRNLAAGSTRKLDANESRKRLLEFFAFDLVSDHLERPSKLAQMQLMQNAGFSVVPFTYVDSTGGEELLRKAVDSYKPEHYGYPVDGLIVEYDDRAYGASLGATGHHENRMIALKWKDDPVPTKFLGVDLATTRTGRVSITGLFEPVAIDGASLFAKVFILTVAVLLCVSFLVYGVLAWYMPQTYSNNLNAALDEQTSDFIYELEHIRMQDSGGLFDQFLQNTTISMVELYTADGVLVETPSNQNSFNDGITGEALGGASYESAPIISNSYYFSFADDNSQYILTVYGEASQIAELRQSFVSVLPILFCVILLVSLATAYL